MGRWMYASTSNCEAIRMQTTEVTNVGTDTQKREMEGSNVSNCKHQQGLSLHRDRGMMRWVVEFNSGNAAEA